MPKLPMPTVTATLFVGQRTRCPLLGFAVKIRDFIPDEIGAFERAEAG